MKIFGTYIAGAFSALYTLWKFSMAIGKRQEDDDSDAEEKDDNHHP